MTDNPRISFVLRTVTWLEVVILLWAGAGLLFYPPVARDVWPWALTPFNLRFLGALYLAALIAAWLQAISGRWSPSRVVTAMIFVFTLVVTVLSFVHLSRFDPRRVETWIWFVLYVGVCVNAGVHWWLYRRWRTRGAGPPAGTLRTLLACVATILGLYGLALLAAPDTASGFWPWKLDAFHAQLYSVTFLTPAVGAWLLMRSTTPAERVALGATLAAWGGLPIVGLLLADATAKRVPWASPATWAWLALFAAMLVAGTWIAMSRRPDVL